MSQELRRNLVRSITGFVGSRGKKMKMIVSTLEKKKREIRNASVRRRTYLSPLFLYRTPLIVF